MYYIRALAEKGIKKYHKSLMWLEKAKKTATES